MMQASRVCNIEAQLCVRYVKLFDKKYENIQQSSPATPASYPIKHVVMKTHSVAQGISSLNWENAHVGQLPKRVFFVMAVNDACTGSISKNPLNFKHFYTPQVGIFLNGKCPPTTQVQF